MTRNDVWTLLLRHGVAPSADLLDELTDFIGRHEDEAWLDNEQALALLPHLNGVKSLAMFLRKHRVRRRTAVQRTADVLRAVAAGDRRRRRA